MASGVEVVEVAGQVLEPLQVVGHRLVGKAAQVLLGRTGVHRVGRMRDKRADIVLVFVVQEGLDIREVELLRAAAARIAREKGKCVCIELDRLMPHGQESLGRGEVAADVQFMFSRHVILQSLSIIFICYSIAYKKDVRMKSCGRLFLLRLYCAHALRYLPGGMPTMLLNTDWK